MQRLMIKIWMKRSDLNENYLYKLEERQEIIEWKLYHIWLFKSNFS